MTKFFWEGKEIYSTLKRKEIALEEAKRFCDQKAISYRLLVSEDRSRDMMQKRSMVAKHLQKLKFTDVYIGHALGRDHACVKAYLKPNKYEGHANVISVYGEPFAVLDYFGVLPSHYKRMFKKQFADRNGIDVTSVSMVYEYARKDLPSWKPELKG